MNIETTDPLMGRQLGDFIVKEKLGEGGFGAVYKASQITLAREAVIKVLHLRHRTNPQVIERFKREAQLASKLEHPYCAHIYSFGAESDGLLWIAMEMVAGTPLNEIIKSQGPLPLERFVPLLDKICEVVHTAHDFGIIHRDLKPANVMVISRAGRLLPKLLDFGIAKGLELPKVTNIKSISTNDLAQEISEDAKNTKEDAKVNTDANLASKTKDDATGVIGSPRYMAPELWESGSNANFRTDIYALGVLAYEVLTDSPPFPLSGPPLMFAHMFKPIPPLGSSFPIVLDEVITKAMAKDPKDRYQTALEFAKDFREAAGFTEQQINLPQLDEILKENILANAPKPLADTVASLVVARNAYQFRDRALLVFRVLVRYIGLLALACYGRVATKQQDNDLVAKAMANLRQQGLSETQWAELSRELCRPFAKKRDAYAIPELVNLFFALDSEQLSPITETFAKLLQLQHEIHSSASLKEEQLVKLLADFLVTLTSLLKATVWLSDYYLALPEAEQATKWMGKGQDLGLISIKSSNLASGKAVLVDANGYFVLSLWPLIEITEPTPGAPPEVFLLEGKGRHGAKLVSFPDGFEVEQEAPWQWLKETFLTDEEKKQTGFLTEKSPYLGLTTFSPTDSSLFFGREQETESFLNRLRIQPLLAVVGPSGAGKSSFIQAGVIAGLAENWQVVTVRPGLSPLSTLANKLSKAGLEIADLKADLQKDSDTLAKILRQFATKQNITLLLVVDQFEEIITLCLDKLEQKLYVEAIVSLARSEEDPIRVVLTMRDDFLVRTKELKGLKDRLTQGLEILTTPDSTQLLRILTEPAKRAGYEFEDPELPVEIVDAVTGQTSALPLIAFTAAKLWEQRDTQFKQLRRKTYESMGGVGGALAKHAEETMQQMPQTEQSLVREAFRHLVTSEGTRAVLTRPEVLQLLGKTSDSETVIEKLISSRLLVATEGEKGVDRIEVVHEALLSAWPRLVKWRQEDAEGARLRDQLRAAARQWQERNRPRGLLWRDEALAEYQLWRTHYKGKLTEVEEDFGATSLSEATRNQRIRRALVIAAVVVLMIGSSVLFYQQQKTKQQLSQTLELYEEQGRQEIIKANLDGAAVYLSEAYDKGANSLALRYMLSVALAKAENRPAITLTNHTEAVMCAAFSPDDKMVVSASADKTARIWQSSDGKELFVLKGHEDSVVSAQFSPDGTQVVTSSLDKTAKLWKVADGSLVATLTGHTDGLRSAIFSPDGKQIVTVSYDTTAKIWDSSNGKLINTLIGHQGGIYAVCYSKDSKLIATASTDKTARIWDSSNGKLLTTLSGHQGNVTSVAFSPDNKLIITGSSDSTAKVWQVPEGKLVHTLAKHEDGITSTKFSLEGKSILTTSKDKTACIWDTETGKLANTLTGHESDIGTGEFSPDGKLILTSAYDKTARIWERFTGKFLVTLPGHVDSLSSGVFSSNGEKVLTASVDKTVNIWSVVAESRLPNEISMIVKEKVPIDLKEGRLIPREQKTNNEKANAEKQDSPIENKIGENTIIETLDNGINIEMVKIEGGTFEMGSPLDEKEHGGDEILHTVTVSPFYIGKYEVTQAQWNVVANQPTIKTFLLAHPSSFKGDNLPVEQVTWDEAVEFCARLSKMTGKTYRLPTEAEWEYASRAGSKGAYAGNLDDMAWYEKNSEKKAHVIGQKLPNAWGLYDMHGNVWEWCSDWYGNYSSGAVTDPSGASTGSYRIFRGGSFGYGTAYCRSAFRGNFAPSFRINDLGFRLVRTVQSVP